MNKIKILTVFGTRPEVIKLAPFIKEVESDSDCINITCATTQHRELQNDVLNLFGVLPDYDLDVMTQTQDLFDVTTSVLEKMKGVLDETSPDYIVVQGDTTTAFASALAAFYKKIPIVHVEAGLRTGNLSSPFPEEANRSLISRIAKLHMAPTERAVENLRHEGITNNVFKVGNTIVDSVHWSLKNFKAQSSFIKEKIQTPELKVLITVHRRENFGEPLRNICEAIKTIVHQYPDITFIWPLHPNPNVRQVVLEAVGTKPNLHLIEPLIYSDLLLLMNACRLILSDSGGIQEEACILGKQLLILRENSERMEFVESGLGHLVGSDPEKIVTQFTSLMKDSQELPSWSEFHSVYGMPGVSKNILTIMKKALG